MEKSNWIIGTMFLFVVFGFFGGYYIGASNMKISFEMDESTEKSINHLTDVIEFVQKSQLQARMTATVLEVKEKGNYSLWCAMSGNTYDSDLECIIGDLVN